MGGGVGWHWLSLVGGLVDQLVGCRLGPKALEWGPKRRRTVRFTPPYTALAFDRRTHPPATPQIVLHDGRRVQRKFNLTHTLRHVQAFIAR